MGDTTIKIEEYCSACGDGMIATAAICPKFVSSGGRSALSGEGPNKEFELTN
jgi:hypothetical protein